MPQQEQKRRVCVILVDRANYGRLKPVMRAIDDHPDLELTVLAAGTMVLERFGRAVEVVRGDGFEVHSEVYMELEGSTPVSMAKSVGFGVVEFANELQRLRPDLVLMIGDRYEALAATIAAAYLNLCIVHLQGGEVSGSIDESARHAISKFAHFHVPSTQRSMDYLVRMGENPATILDVGCPSSDIAKTLDVRVTSDMVNTKGSGAWIDVEKPYLLAVYHPTTTSFGQERREMQALLGALDRVRMPTLLLWPNIDAGADRISKEIRLFRDQVGPNWLRTITNSPPDEYLRLLASAQCAVGNSSSFVRDAGFFGTPVVLVGERQLGRERDEHVVPVPADFEQIASALEAQLAHGRYEASTLYGDGDVARRIAERLAELTPYVQKSLFYVNEGLATANAKGVDAPAGVGNIG